MSDHRETVVVKEGGSGATAIVAILVIVLLVAGAWWFLLGPGAQGGTDTAPNDINVNIELPSVAPAAS